MDYRGSRHEEISPQGGVRVGREGCAVGVQMAK